MQRQDPTCFDFFWTQKIRIVGCSYELWIYQFVFIVTVRRVALFICVEINVTRLRRKGVTFKNEINGRSSEDIFVCTQAVRPINIAAVPRNPSQCGAFIFLFVQKKGNWMVSEKNQWLYFSAFLSTLNLGNQVLFKTARKTKTNLPKKGGCPNMEPFHTLQSPKPDTDSTGTGVPFLASTAWVYAPGTNNFPKTKRVCFCVRFPPLCVTYLQQHETVNMFETKNIDAQHGSSCEFYNVAVLICSLPTPGSRIFNMFDVPCGSMPSLCQPHAFQLLDAKKQIHTAIGRPFRMSVPVVAIYFFNKKKEKNAQRHGGP